MNKQLTAEQLAALAKYEDNFRTATRSQWCRYPGQEGVDLMRRTWEELTGTSAAYSAGCSTCLLNLVRDIGTLYFAAKERAEMAQNATKEAKASKTTSEPRKARKTKANK